MKKIWVGIGIIIVVALAVVLTIMRLAGEPAGEPKEIKIGAILVLTGPDARTGQSAKEGIALAAQEINEDGGIKGKKLVIIYEDDQGQPQQSVSAAKKLISVDNVPVILGPMWSTSVLAVAPIAEKNKVVILSSTASAPTITEAGDFIFRNTYNDIYEGSKDAEYAYKKMGYKRAGIVHVNLDAGIQIADVFVDEFEKLGGTIVIREKYEVDAKDFRTILTKFKNEQLDFIYLMGYSEMGQLVKQAKEIGLNIPFVSTIMFEISDVVEVAGNAAEGTVYSFPSYDPEKGGDVVKEFARKYREKYGRLPDPEAAFSYDALKILASVMSQVGFKAVSIKEGLYKVKDYHGVTGITSFDESGDVVKPIGFKIVKNGQYVWEIFMFE